jgi:hypothetical protein
VLQLVSGVSLGGVRLVEQVSGGSIASDGCGWILEIGNIEVLLQVEIDNVILENGTDAKTFPWSDFAERTGEEPTQHKQSAEIYFRRFHSVADYLLFWFYSGLLMKLV